MSRLVDGTLRIALTAAHHLLKATWFVRRPKTFGAHAVALTADNRIILVKLRYAPGWRVPGGGRSENEDKIEAALRELREEIGMTAHGDARLAGDFDEAVNFKRDRSSLVVVRDVLYRPHRWSWEVEQVMEADFDDLPADISLNSRAWIESVGSLL